MRITLEELKTTENLVIDLLEILSIEGQQYMARLHGEWGMKMLADNQGQTRLFRSTWQVQDTLGSLDIKETQVVLPSAYHEMVGMPTTDLEPMRIQIQRQRS